MVSVRPRRLTHAGWVEASGLVLATDVVSEASCRARVLEHWQAGAQLYVHGTSWLLLFAATRWLDSRCCVGTPLMADGGLLVGCPLSTAERALLPDHGVVLAAGGQLAVVDIDQLSRLDPADWLDVSEFCIVPVSPLASPPTPVVERLASPRADVTSALIGKLGTAPAARGELRQALVNLRDRQPPADGLGDSTGSSARPHGWFRRLLSRSPWARVIGRQHARYLRSMAKMFERGDYDKALLHAIPAGEVADAAHSAAFARLAPRSRIQIEPTRGSVGGTVNLNVDSYDYMTGLYRAAFAGLEAEGRIDEAAYVLLELLGETEEGVMFLAENDRRELAAEVAEARGLAPGLVVRLWFGAGQPARAVRFARRTGAFADAVVRLERVDRDSAAKLRLLWADHAASAGDYAVAVEAAWPVVEARSLARSWIERAIDAGGPLGARMLVKKLDVAPDQAPVVMRHAHELMVDASPASQHVRTALARAVADGSSSTEHISLGSLVVRGIVRDAAVSGQSELRKLAKRLQEQHVEPVLRADLPRGSEIGTVELAERTDPALHRFDSGDVGAAPVHDAILLPNGRMLVGLGELGLQLRGRSGRVITHFDCPTYQLAVAGNGLRALALAPRAGSTLLTRIDVERRKAEPWAKLVLTARCERINRSLWFAASAGEVRAIDTTTSPPEVLWRVAEAGWCVTALASSETLLSILWRRRDGSSELWTYELPGLRMVHRIELPHAPGRIVESALAPGGDVCATVIAGDRSEHVVTRVFRATMREMVLSADLGRSVLPVAMSDTWLVTSTIVGARFVLQLLDVAQARARASISLAGVTSVRARLVGGSVTICDDRGRVLALSTVTGELLHDVRVSL